MIFRAETNSARSPGRHFIRPLEILWRRLAANRSRGRGIRVLHLWVLGFRRLMA